MNGEIYYLALRCFIYIVMSRVLSDRATISDVLGNPKINNKIMNLLQLFPQNDITLLFDLAELAAILDFTYNSMSKISPG